MPLTGKTAALLALLASSPNGRRTRAWLQDMLWPRSGEQHGRASLRQALAKLKRTLGDAYPDLLDANNQDVWMNLEAVTFTGSPHDGDLLEGLDLSGADGFETWLTEQRQRVVAGFDEDSAERIVSHARPINAPEDAPPSFPVAKLRPAIAILPFAHCGTDRIEAAFGDMIAGDLSRLIARAPGIDVISHLSCRMPGFVDADMGRLRAAFGVDYLVTGFLRASGSNMMLDLEFADSRSGLILNTERFSRSKRDWLEGRADSLQDIAGYIVASLFKGAIRNVGQRPLADADAHALLMSAIALMHRMDLASVLRAHQYLQEVINRFGPSSLPYAWLAQWYVLFLAQGWSTDVDSDREAARAMVNRALSANPDCSFSQVMSGVVTYQIERDYSAATLAFNDVLSLDSNNAMAWFWKGVLLAFEGRGGEAVSFTERGRLLAPLDPGSYLYSNLSGTAYLSNRSYDKALELADVSLGLNRHHASALRTRIVALCGLGRVDEARKSGADLLKVSPNFTVESYLTAHPAAELDMGREWARALEESGIPRN